MSNSLIVNNRLANKPLIKLIAIDMDGTLLNNAHEVTPGVRQALAAARQQGVQIVLTTGRPYSGVKPYLADLGMMNDTDFCITYNGALTLRGDGYCLDKTELTFADYRELEALSRQLGVHIHAFDHHRLYTPNADIGRYTIHEAALTHIPLSYRALSEMDPEMTFTKVMMVDEAPLLDRALAAFPAEILSRFTVLRSAPFYLEILHKEVDKGHAVARLAARLGLSAENVMALGDQENDLGMIRYAGMGVAMGNAIPELHDVCNYITRTNEEDGVAHAIERFVLSSSEY